MLVLKGFISADYLMELRTIANLHRVDERLVYIGPTDYRGVIENGKTCHIGIAIHKKTDIMNKTLGTASNKIYEYAALGLPVILFHNAHFREVLGRYKSAFFTNTEINSFRENALWTSYRDYQSLSREAFEDFYSKLSFEDYLEPVKEISKTSL